MTEALLVVVIIQLGMIWREMSKVVDAIEKNTKHAIVGLGELDNRLAEIQGRVRDNLQTEEEREIEVDRQP